MRRYEQEQHDPQARRAMATVELFRAEALWDGDYIQWCIYCRWFMSCTSLIPSWKYQIVPFKTRWMWYYKIVESLWEWLTRWNCHITNIQYKFYHFLFLVGQCKHIDEEVCIFRRVSKDQSFLYWVFCTVVTTESLRKSDLKCESSAKYCIYQLLLVQIVSKYSIITFTKSCKIQKSSASWVPEIFSKKKKMPKTLHFFSCFLVNLCFLTAYGLIWWLLNIF